MAASQTSALQDRREALAAAVAAARGPDDRATVEDHVADLIAGRASPETEPVARLLAAYRDLADLPADEADVRLAEEGEVFAPEDDA